MNTYQLSPKRIVPCNFNAFIKFLRSSEIDFAPTRILWDTGNALKITFPTISVLFLGLNLTKTKANSCTFFFS